MSLKILSFGNIEIPNLIFFECKEPFHSGGLWKVTDDTLKAIENLIQENYEYVFKNANKLLEYLAKSAGNALCSAYKDYHPQLKYRKIKIEMTGSYRADFINAAYIAEQQYGVRGFNSYDGTMSGYVWHHCENVTFQGKKAYCKMELLTIESHRIPHKGGVHEYEQTYGVTYG